MENGKSDEKTECLPLNRSGDTGISVSLRSSISYDKSNFFSVIADDVFYEF
jgi:hypothetical protein